MRVAAFRVAMVSMAAAAVLMVATAAAPARAETSCAAPAGFDPRGRIDGREVVVLYRTVPPAIEVGRHFAVEALVCAQPSAPVAAVRVDARMPEHRHGMNYRARVSSRGEGLYRAEGLLFHMPGRWHLLFDVERGGRTERLEAEVTLE
jgi:hypothetical protein